VLSRAVWSPLALARTLLMMLTTFVSDEQALIFGLDETIERRWGCKIKASGVYRDGVRSTSCYRVMVSGLRWVSVMLLTEVGWAQRVWALPVLTALAPSAPFYARMGRAHKSLPQRALQLLRILRRWLPQRQLVVVGDGGYASMPFLTGCTQLQITAIVRLQLNAALYDPPPPPSGKRGRPRVKGERQIKLAQRLKDPQTVWQTLEVAWYGGQRRDIEVISQCARWYKSGKGNIAGRWVLIRDPQRQFPPTALWCTHPLEQDSYAVRWIIETFVKRWAVEVTFAEARRHLGVESQRQWSDRAIARTTPMLFGLYSWVTLVAQRLYESGESIEVRRSAWYPKSQPTFSDGLARVRRLLWHYQASQDLWPPTHEARGVKKIPLDHWKALLEALSYTA
jgi:hypothetical protein